MTIFYNRESESCIEIQDDSQSMSINLDEAKDLALQLDNAIKEAESDIIDNRVRKFVYEFINDLVNENSEYGLDAETKNKILTWLEQRRLLNEKLQEIDRRLMYLKKV